MSFLIKLIRVRPSRLFTSAASYPPPPPLPSSSSDPFSEDFGASDDELRRLKELARSSPRVVGSQTLYAKTLSDRGMHGQALAVLSSALLVAQADRDKAEVFCAMGEANDRLGAVTDAQSRYREALRVDPGMTLAHLRLGWNLVADGLRGRVAARLTEASDVFERGIAVATSAKIPAETLADFSFGRGTALSMTGKLAEAEGCFSRALALNPNLAPAYSARGDARLGLGRPAEAVEDYTSYIDRFQDYYAAMMAGAQGSGPHPNDIFVDVLTRRGLAYQMTNQHAQALVDLDHAFRVMGPVKDHTPQQQSKAAVIFSTRGRTHLALGAASKALADQNEALRRNPKLIVAYVERAKANDALKNKEEAEEDRKMATVLSMQLAGKMT